MLCLILASIILKLLTQKQMKMRNILSFPLAIFAVILCFGITACGSDDDNDGGFSTADLTANTWSLDAISDNLIGKGGEVAEAFTEQEVIAAGHETVEALAVELNFIFALISTITLDDCDRETVTTFNEDGTLMTDEACPDGSVSPASQEGNLTWSLDGDQLTFIETDNGDVTRYVYRVTTLNSSTLELRLEGNNVLRGFEYETAADPDIQITYVLKAN